MAEKQLFEQRGSIVASRHGFLLLASFCVMFVSSGCGSKHGAKVEGHVTLDGQPLPATCLGSVAFYPSSGGPPAMGRIDEDSNYTLSTGREPSLPPGDYKVTVAANEPPSTLVATNGLAPPPGKPITPPRYRQSRTSGLQYTVDSGSNEINLELTSK